MSQLESNNLDSAKLKWLVEAFLFVRGSPVTVEEIAKILDFVPAQTIRESLERLMQEYELSERGLKIMEVAGGYQMVTQRELAPWVKRFIQQMPQRLSRACLETLAIVAYRQPITRGEIEQVRGVNADAALQTLLGKGIVRILGRRDVIGRPFLYGTTPLFLVRFGLASLKDLPNLEEVLSESESAPKADRPIGSEVIGNPQPSS